jgi:PAS domain S-box-containing protein
MDQQQIDQDQQHEEWLAGIASQLAPIFDNSEEGVYVYLDDRHKICNERLAKMWGYASAAEWAAAPDFLETFVATQPDRVQVSTNYHQHVHRELTAYQLQFTAKRKDGRSVRVETQTVPFAYDGQLFAYAFVRPLTARAKARP